MPLFYYRPLLIAEEDLSGEYIALMLKYQEKKKQSVLSRLQAIAGLRARMLGHLITQAFEEYPIPLAPKLEDRIDKVIDKDLIPLQMPSGSENDQSFMDVIKSCLTLECLQEAHQLKGKSSVRFNFPHALLVGWQKSATTSLYHHLSKHGNVLASNEKVGVHLLTTL